MKNSNFYAFNIWGMFLTGDGLYLLSLDILLRPFHDWGLFFFLVSNVMVVVIFFSLKFLYWTFVLSTLIYNIGNFFLFFFWFY